MSSTTSRYAATAAPSRHSSRLSLTFGLVMGSGIIVTILSYVLLQMIMSQAEARRDEYFFHRVDTRIQERVGRLSGEMALFNIMVGHNVGFMEVKDYIARQPAAGRMSTFQQLLWVGIHPDQKQKYQIEMVLFVQDGSETRMTSSLQKSVLQELEKTKGRFPGPTNLLPLDPNVRRYEEVADSNIRHKIGYSYTAFVSPSIRADGASGYLVGIVPFKNIFAYSDMIANGQRLSLSLGIEGHSDLLTIYPGDRRGPSGAGAGHSVNILARPMGLSTQGEESFEQNLVAMIPLAIPLIGVLMTILGGFYVRNNQKQALMLTKMNKALALKNMEMNSQVTERERLNQVLRKTEQEKRAIMDSVSDIIFEVDQKGDFMFLNEAWYRITGFPVEQSKGLNLFDMMERSVRDLNRKTFEKIVLGQESAMPFSVDILASGDNYRRMQVRYSMIRMDDNNNPRVVGTITDMEEFRRTESALAEAEEKYRTIWENAVTGIYQVSLDGQLISANPALARIFGYASPEEMLDEVTMMNRQLYASAKDRQTVINRLMEAGRASNIEAQGTRRDRSHFWILESARVVRDTNGGIMYLEGSIDDITERKEAELRLKSAMTELELANRAKTEFLANMSHELRTPLNAIIGFSEIIKDEVFGRLEQRQYHEYARDIHDSGRNLLNIINTILDVSRIEAGERQLNETVIQIPELVRGVIELINPRIEENNQVLKINLPERMPMLWAEELAIKQILLNLMSNASKFTPSGGMITLSANIDDAGDLHLIVADTGIGLDDEEIARVMAPFGQASGSFSRSSSGPGLGLTLVNALTRLHGGHVEMISQKGVGTTASIILPASRLK